MKIPQSWLLYIRTTELMAMPRTRAPSKRPVWIIILLSFVCTALIGAYVYHRYIEHMLPEIEKKDWRKGSQWFTMKRSHAVLILADNLYYTKFKLYCKPGMEGHCNCYADEHYLPTLFHMVDLTRIANWSVTHVDWSKGKWHPKAYIAQDVTFDLLKNITSIYVSTHVTSETIKEVQQRPCLWNGMRRPCYLFARKFYPEALDESAAPLTSFLQNAAMVQVLVRLVSEVLKKMSERGSRL